MLYKSMFGRAYKITYRKIEKKHEFISKISKLISPQNIIQTKTILLAYLKGAMILIGFASHFSV